MIARGAHSWVRITPTGLPDCTNIVSSRSNVSSVRSIARYESQLRAALPVPPYTTSSSGFSATSGSRLFCNIRYAASCGQPLQFSSVPRGAAMFLTGSPIGPKLCVAELLMSCSLRATALRCQWITLIVSQ